MSGLATPRLRVPRIARAGEAFEVRLLMEHRMESGIRIGAPSVPRDMLASMTVAAGGETLFEARFGNGTAANPFHVFWLRLDRTADLVFTYADEQGRTASATHRVTVA
ncbi:thiosulfate oxidation carrier complex protein SoxZ [Elioraea rosea]|uniref:thiosulfate oxidation carrier complex protein SoxZ n=1 Tax=Elioraea rosea TaxID=2492390 RepID=UPI0011825EB1|nr:thiosulfate oxidation carrier complex protein SoxZ [Elioraea rosea]